MFFKKNKSTVNQRVKSYLGQVGIVSKDIRYGRGRAVMEDKTIWCVVCEDYDIMANAKVLVTEVVDSLSLRVKPINY